MRPSEAKQGLTFDDVTLAPVHSKIRSRQEPDVSTNLGKFILKTPIISAPMNTVTESLMAHALHYLGATGVIHRYLTVEEQVRQAKFLTFTLGISNFFMAIGAAGDFMERASMLYDAGTKNFCVDVANGHGVVCLEAIEALKKKFPDIHVMGGNVCTADGFWNLIQAGSDSIRVGVGPGSMCKTRIVTGHGVPQLTAIEECANVKFEYPSIGLIADGGIRNSGDIVKALAAGADAVMVGGLLAGTDETPGEVVRYSEHEKYKKYAGMASEEGRSLNGWFDRTKTSFVPEGVSTEVLCKGPVKDVVDNLIGGLKVGMSYANAKNLAELRKNAEWVRVTENGRLEGTPHGK